MGSTSCETPCIQAVPCNTFHDFSTTCDNLTKTCFRQKLFSFRLAIQCNKRNLKKKIIFFFFSLIVRVTFVLLNGTLYFWLLQYCSLYLDEFNDLVWSWRQRNENFNKKWPSAWMGDNNFIIKTLEKLRSIQEPHGRLWYTRSLNFFFSLTIIEGKKIFLIFFLALYRQPKTDQLLLKTFFCQIVASTWKIVKSVTRDTLCIYRRINFR